MSSLILAQLLLVYGRKWIVFTDSLPDAAVLKRMLRGGKYKDNKQGRAVMLDTNLLLVS